MQTSPNSPPAIRDLFARISRRYDLNNRLHSLGRDRSWRRAAAAAAGMKNGDCTPAQSARGLSPFPPGRRVLDVACGTGDLTALLSRAGGEVTGLDFCPEMLQIARRKYGAREDGHWKNGDCTPAPSTGGLSPFSPIEWVQADATRMPFENARFSAVTCAFGLRNLPDISAALREFRRVLAPGGRLVILDFAGGGPRGPLAPLLRLWTHRILPRTAGWLARNNREAYQYLCRSIDAFPPPQALAGTIRQAGFAGVACRTMTFGTVALHTARRPMREDGPWQPEVTADALRQRLSAPGFQ